MRGRSCEELLVAIRIFDLLILNDEGDVADDKHLGRPLLIGDVKLPYLSEDALLLIFILLLLLLSVNLKEIVPLLV